MRTDTDLSGVRWHAGVFNNGLIFGLTYYLVTRLPRAGSYAIGRAVTWLAYQLMRDGLGMSAAEMADTFTEWNKGELDSFLIEITSHILAFNDTDGQPLTTHNP